MSHEKLGRKIGEKISVLRKLEGGRMKPDDKLAEKLQYALKVKLLVATEDEKFLPKTSGVSTTPLTLGDLIKNRKNESEEAK